MVKRKFASFGFLVSITCILFSAGCKPSSTAATAVDPPKDNSGTTPKATGSTQGNSTLQTTNQTSISPAAGDAALLAVGKPVEAANGPLDKLVTKDLVEGSGSRVVAAGDSLTMEYTGKLADGTVFDSNAPKDSTHPDKPPFTFTYGGGSVIKGWDQGMTGMKVGGVRVIGVPYTLGYGAEGSAPKIPAKADLFFTVKLLGMVKKGEETIYDKKDLKAGKGAEVKPGDLVSIAYKVSLLNGQVVQEAKANHPVRFTAKTGKVPGGKLLNVRTIAYGVVGMKVGGVRELTIPPMIGFQPGTAPPGVPEGSILVFDVTLLKIKPGG